MEVTVRVVVEGLRTVRLRKAVTVVCTAEVTVWRVTEGTMRVLVTCGPAWIPGHVVPLMEEGREIVLGYTITLIYFSH